MHFAHAASRNSLRRFILFFRGILYFGLRHHCPCCEWRFRAYADKWSLFSTTRDGYCPRCNAKARHRRLWLYLREHTNLFEDRLTLLEVAPWWSLFRALRPIRTLTYIGLDKNRHGDQVTLVGDLTAIPLSDASVDAALCIHTLEHVDDDRTAISELFRVLKPGAWAIVSVPIRLDRPTFEDPSIKSPEEREKAFGERGHVRWYGSDFAARLRKGGFHVHMDPAREIPESTRKMYGLRDDENLFHCSKSS